MLLLKRFPTLGAEPRFITVDRPTGDAWVTYSRTAKLARLQVRTERELEAARDQARSRRRR